MHNPGRLDRGGERAWGRFDVHHTAAGHVAGVARSEHGMKAPGVVFAPAQANRAEEGLRIMLKILLVEDNEAIWDFLSRRLRRHAFDVAVATDGREGVEKSRTENPDVILLDMNLPVLDGW